MVQNSTPNIFNCYLNYNTHYKYSINCIFMNLCLNLVYHLNMIDMYLRVQMIFIIYYLYH